MDTAAIRALDREQYLSLATFRRTGIAVETPVWFAACGDKLYVFSEARAGKMKRLRNDSQVRFAACNVRGKVHGGWTPGTAQTVRDSAAILRAYAAFDAKYGWLMRIGNVFSRLTGRYDARAFIEIEPA